MSEHIYELHRYADGSGSNPARIDCYEESIEHTAIRSSIEVEWSDEGDVLVTISTLPGAGTAPRVRWADLPQADDDDV